MCFPFLFSSGTDLKPATIVVLHPESDVYVINETRSLVVMCKADGYPPPTVSWLQNGKQLSGQDYTVVPIQSERWANTESTLKIDRTKYPRDNGTYTCKAENNVKVVSQKNVEIFIQSKCNVNDINNNNNEVVPVEVGALGSILLRTIEVGIPVELIKRCALLGLAIILRKVHEM